MRKTRSLSLLVAAFALCMYAPLTIAAGVSSALVVAQNDGLTLDQAVERVRRQYSGRIVSAETKVSGNREIHYIKVLTEDGTVKTVTVPGRTLDHG